eukprot:gene3933-biopygen11365
MAVGCPPGLVSSMPANLNSRGLNLSSCKFGGNDRVLRAKKQKGCVVIKRGKHYTIANICAYDGYADADRINRNSESDPPLSPAESKTRRGGFRLRRVILSSRGVNFPGSTLAGVNSSYAMLPNVDLRGLDVNCEREIPSGDNAPLAVSQWCLTTWACRRMSTSGV